MIRRRNQFLSEKLPLGVDTPAALAATTTVFAWKVGTARTYHVERVVLNVSANYAADASNFYTIAVQDGSTVIASWSTQTSAQGALSANTPVELVLNTTDANLVAAGGDTLTVVATKAASGANFPTFNLVIEGQYL